MQYLSQRLAVESTGTGEDRRPQGAVATTQRERILAATERLIAAKGCAGTTIEGIVKEAGVSSVTFYEHFGDKEECFVAAFDRAVEELRAAIPAGLSGPGQAREALASLLDAIDAEPDRARLCFVEAQQGGPRLRARYEAALDAVAGELSDSLGQAIAGGLAWLLRERLELGGGEGVRDLLPRMTEIVLDPYLVHG
jgi:AcrR family transcriptional regulator